MNGVIMSEEPKRDFPCVMFADCPTTLIDGENVAISCYLCIASQTTAKNKPKETPFTHGVKYTRDEVIALVREFYNNNGDNVVVDVEN